MTVPPKTELVLRKTYAQQQTEPSSLIAIIKKLKYCPLVGFHLKFVLAKIFL